MVSESSDLKYFGGVQSTTGQAANYTSDVAGKVYSTVKQYVPEGLQPHLKVAEDKMSEYGSPAITTLQDKGGKFLQIADTKVRSLSAMCRWQPDLVIQLFPVCHLYSYSLFHHRQE